MSEGVYSRSLAACRAAVVVLAVLLTAEAPAQVAPGEGESARQLKERLKASIDAVLARHVRQLRRALHDAVDATIDGTGARQELDVLLSELESGGSARRPLGPIRGDDAGRRSWASSLDPRVLGAAAEPEPAVNLDPEAGLVLPWELLGVTAKRPSDELAALHGIRAGEGVLVESVRPGSAAALAELRPGDTILDLAGARVTAAGWSRPSRIEGTAHAEMRVVRAADRDTVRSELLLPDGAPDRALDLPDVDLRRELDRMMKDALREVMGGEPILLTPAGPPPEPIKNPVTPQRQP